MPQPEVVLPLLLAHRAAQMPDRVFLREIEGGSTTFAELHENACRWSGALRSVGVERGDYVVSMLPNEIAGIEAWFGINGIGGVEVPIHTEYRGRILAHVLNTIQARAAIVAERYLDRFSEIAEELTTLRTVIVPDATEAAPRSGFAVVDGRTLLASAERLAPVADARPRDICTVLFTSGTTGASKGVLIPYAQIRASTDGCWPLDEIDSDDVNYLMLPNFHISGKVAIDSMLAVGGQVALRERFKTDLFWSDVRATGATCACVMGAMAAFLMAAPKRDDDADNTLDKVLLLPLPPYLDEMRQRFGLRVHTIYNQTEISCPIASEGFRTIGVSCGRLRDGYECRIVDENDEEVPVGQVGELVVRASKPWTMMSGYVGMPEKTVDATQNQWLHTGDAFRIDQEGNFFFVDRFKDVIRRRGENISSIEVEDAVCEHAEVVECAAVPVASEWTEDEVKVFIVRVPGSTLSEAELVEFLRPRLPRFMIPRYIELVNELPKTSTQKVRKAELCALGVTEATWDREAQGAATASVASQPHRDGPKRGEGDL